MVIGGMNKWRDGGEMEVGGIEERWRDEGETIQEDLSRPEEKHVLFVCLSVGPWQLCYSVSMLMFNQPTF